MRTFIAIELPPEIKDALSRLQRQLQNSQADVKWVQPQNIHLTLKFLGERDVKLIEKIMQILQEVTQGQKSFHARISCLGAFPSINSPRIIWVGIDLGDSETKEIAKELEGRISKIGIPKEDRPFSSHITIGRIRSPKNRDSLIQNLNHLQDKFGEFTLEFPVTKITLFKSTLSSRGPIYEVLKEENLKTI